MNVSEEEIDAFGQQEAAARLNPTRLPFAHYLCGACEFSTIQHKDAGMEKRKSTAHIETCEGRQSANTKNRG